MGRGRHRVVQAGVPYAAMLWLGPRQLANGMDADGQYGVVERQNVGPEPHWFPEAISWVVVYSGPSLKHSLEFRATPTFSEHLQNELDRRNLGHILHTLGRWIQIVTVRRIAEGLGDAGHPGGSRAGSGRQNSKGQPDGWPFTGLIGSPAAAAALPRSAGLPSSRGGRVCRARQGGAPCRRGGCGPGPSSGAPTSQSCAC